MFNLKDRHAIVCGSTQGMGRACAFEMARLGAQVTLVARNQNALEAVLRDLPSDAACNHDFICQDFADPDALREKIVAHLRDAGPAHILLNNTGGPPAGPVSEARADDFIAAFKQHVLCNQVLAQAVLPGMKQAGYGRIINIISTSVKTPIPGLGVSNTIRGAVASWAKTLAGEVARFGITVNNILPGYIETQRLHDVFAARAAQTGQMADEVGALFLAQVPAGRFGAVEEVSRVVAFLASPAASYVNGINLPVDGGRTPTL